LSPSAENIRLGHRPFYYVIQHNIGHVAIFPIESHVKSLSEGGILEWSWLKKWSVTPSFFINIISQDTKLASHKISGFLFLEGFTV